MRIYAHTYVARQRLHQMMQSRRRDGSFASMCEALFECMPALPPVPAGFVSGLDVAGRVVGTGRIDRWAWRRRHRRGWRCV